jgi:hypothetical protein
MHTIQTITYTQQNCYYFSNNLITLAEFEPGYSVPEADAMSTAPRRHGAWQKLCPYAPGASHFFFSVTTKETF